METNLFEELILSTGLPRELLLKDLHQRLKLKNFNPENLTLDDIRDLMVEYLQDTILQVSTHPDAMDA